MNTIFFLTSVAVLALGIATESWADKCISDGSTGTGGTWAEAETACKSCGKNCNWELNNGKLTISTKDNATNVSMAIYALYSTPWYDSRTSITSVEIKDGITDIAKNSFYNTSSLTSITIPDSVTSIGDNAFKLASSLTELIIPDSWADSNPTLKDKMFYQSCFSQAQRPSGCPTISEMKIVCQGKPDKCTAALAKFGVGDNTCSVGTSDCLNSGISISKANSKQCTGVGYTFVNNECRRKAESECAAPYIYVSSGTSGMCKTRNQTQCTGEDYTWTNNHCKYTAPTPSGDGNGDSGGTGDSVNTTCPDGYEFKEDEGCVDKYPYSKKHWTPAEVNKWLYDDNNTITITFKK